MTKSIQQRYAPLPERAYNWRDDAACLSHDPELFSPLDGQAMPPEYVRRARKICRECPVIMECLQDALRYSNTEQYGIAGGMTAPERIQRRKIITDGTMSKQAILQFIDQKIK